MVHTHRQSITINNTKINTNNQIRPQTKKRSQYRPRTISMSFFQCFLLYVAYSLPSSVDILPSFRLVTAEEEQNMAEDVVVGEEEEEYYHSNYVDLTDVDLDDMSIMPVSCVNYKNGHMVKFQLFKGQYNFQCHAKSVGSYVVSISHYMRLRFNYLSLVNGQEFTLPPDVGYLNCVQLRETSKNDQKLYARIGCQDHSSYTSAHLSLHVYTDRKCRTPYDDGQTTEQHIEKGYIINHQWFETGISFRPEFYKCDKCRPWKISSSFQWGGADGNSGRSVWYDDDADAKYRYFDDWLDDYVGNDDSYAAVQNYVNNVQRYNKDDDDDFYTLDDDRENGDEDGKGRKMRRELGLGIDGMVVKKFTPVEGEFKKFEQDFWNSQRQLGNNDDALDDKIKNWDICTNLYKYSIYCGNECQAADNFRVDEWSAPDLFLFSLMLAFISITTALVLYNRHKDIEQAKLYEGGDDPSHLVMHTYKVALLFLVGVGCIVIMAFLRLIQYSLVMAAVGCVAAAGCLVKTTCFKEDGKGSAEALQPTPYNLT